VIRLGESEFWLDPTAMGWFLVRAVPDPDSRGAISRRYGPFATLGDLQEQQQVELPKEARRELAKMIEATQGPDALDLPPVS
jgi:hypothetical protein